MKRFIGLLLIYTIHLTGVEYIDELNRAIADEGFLDTQEHICSAPTQQAQWFIDLLRKERWIQSVCEIGFNAGHSSVVFLQSRPDITVTSFELNCGRFAVPAKAFIDTHFPGRHTLIPGDSRITVPKYFKADPFEKFDLIFIDGGHTFKMAAADIKNMRNLAHEKTIVVLDDAHDGMEVDRAHRICKHMGLIYDCKRHIGNTPQNTWPRVWIECKYRLSGE